MRKTNAQAFLSQMKAQHPELSYRVTPSTVHLTLRREVKQDGITAFYEHSRWHGLSGLTPEILRRMVDTILQDATAPSVTPPPQPTPALPPGNAGAQAAALLAASLAAKGRLKAARR